MIRASATAKAILRTDKPVNKDGKRPVNILVYNGSKQQRFATGYFVEDKHWDKKAGNVIINRTSDSDLRFISDKIAQIINDFKVKVNKMELAKLPVTENDIMSHFKGSGHESFYDYYERIIEAYKPSIRPDTYRVYKTTLWIVKEFRKTLAFADVNNDFVRDFDNYLRVKRKNKNGGVAGYYHQSDPGIIIQSDPPKLSTRLIA
jgi:hypothetical protein